MLPGDQDSDSPLTERVMPVGTDPNGSDMDGEPMGTICTWMVKHVYNSSNSMDLGISLDLRHPLELTGLQERLLCGFSLMGPGVLFSESKTFQSFHHCHHCRSKDFEIFELFVSPQSLGGRACRSWTWTSHCGHCGHVLSGPDVWSKLRESEAEGRFRSKSRSNQCDTHQNDSTLIV